MRINQALKGRHRFLADYAKACVALSGLDLNSILKPRVPEPAVRAPPPWTLLHRAFSALGIRLSFTRMPFRTDFRDDHNHRAHALGLTTPPFQGFITWRSGLRMLRHYIMRDPIRTGFSCAFCN